MRHIAVNTGFCTVHPDIQATVINEPRFHKFSNAFWCATVRVISEEPANLVQNCDQTVAPGLRNADQLKQPCMLVLLTKCVKTE